jgi:ribosomal protein L12E/L44/L45/RPP1/RPP2
VLKAANVSVEAYWPNLFAKTLASKSLDSLITNVGAGAQTRVASQVACGSWFAWEKKGRVRRQTGVMISPLGLVALCCGLLNAHTQPQSRTRPCCPRHSAVFHLRPRVFCATHTPCFTFLPAGGGAPAAAAAPSAGGAPAGGAAPAAESKKKEEKKARPAVLSGANSLLSTSVCFAFAHFSHCAPARSTGGGGRGGRLRHVSVRLETQFAACLLPEAFILPV